MNGPFAQAEELLLAGRHRECADYCRQALDRYPRSVTLRLCLAKALLRARRHLAALHEVERCLQIDPGSAQARALLESIEQATDYAVDESGPTMVRGLQVLSNGAYAPRPVTPQPPPPPRPMRPPRPVLPVAAASASIPPPVALLPRAGQIVSAVRPPPARAPTPPARAPSLIGRALEAARFRKSMRAALWITVGFAAALPLSRLTGRPATGPMAAAILPAPAREDRPMVLPPDATVMALLNDLWIHPLAGPNRRMPIRDSRLFGAEREGDRPGECRGGHCGVDIGGERYGEPVLAVHDGIVEHVERGPNPLRGGQFVRIAHRDGSVYTQYFHLASIPARLAPGAAVKVGDVIGFVGRSGVHRSGPHLHFTIAVMAGSSGEERYIDPEPLIALWPLRTTSDADGAPTIVTGIAPGAARGHLRHSRRHRHAHHDAD